MELIYEHADHCIAISQDKELNIIMIQFQGVVEHEAYQEAYRVFMELAASSQCLKYIYHTKKIKKVSVRSRIWYLNHVFPNLYKSTMLTAIVNAEHIGSQVATDTMRDALIEMGYDELNVQRFESFEEAKSWLRSR